MKTSTKIQSYKKITKGGYCETRIQQILDILDEKKWLSRSEIASLTGIPLSSVCGRIYTLLVTGDVKVNGKKWDASTMRWVESLSPGNYDVELGEQRG